MREGAEQVGDGVVPEVGGGQRLGQAVGDVVGQQGVHGGADYDPEKRLVRLSGRQGARSTGQERG